MVGIEMTGTEDLFLASNLRAFFIFWRDSSRAASPVPPVPLGVVDCLLEESAFPLGRESESTSPPGVWASQYAVFWTSTGPGSRPVPTNEHSRLH
jgi:hypothetical protein